MSKQVGRIAAEVIHDEDVTHAFCVPGESYLPVIDAFHDITEVTLVTTHHEESAGFMAGAWAKATGRTGVTLVTRGPGLTHAAIAIHAAYQDSTPMVVLAGQVPTALRGRESFQEIDLAGLGTLLGKEGFEISGPNQAEEQLRYAFNLARSGRPGPVVVSLPEDIGYMSAPITEAQGRRAAGVSTPDSKQLAAAAHILARARSIAIIAGGGVLYRDAAHPLIELAEEIGATVYCAWRRFDAFPNNHRLFCGNLPWLPDDLTEPLRSSEVILSVGGRLDDFTSLHYTIPTPSQQLVYMDSAADSANIGRGQNIDIIGDVNVACRELISHLRELHDSELRETRTKTAEGVSRRYSQLSKPQHRPVEAGFVDLPAAICTLRKLTTDETAIVSDAGAFSGFLNRYYQWRTPGTFFGTTSGAMGYAVPAAIGVKLADATRPVVAVAGDGGFAMTMSEVHTAVRLGLSGLCFVIFDNGVYGTILEHQNRKFPGRQIGVYQGSMDLAALGASTGAESIRVTDNVEFEDAIRWGLAASVPTVVQAITSPTQLNPWSGYHD